jgi:uncharacterized membrane protein YdjX (TVP38/TMEM64 family)
MPENGTISRDFPQKFKQYGKVAAPIIVVLFMVIVICWRHEGDLLDIFHKFLNTVSRKEEFGCFVAGFGSAGPVVFVLIQICQVILAPIPGEVSGFIGGYLFGAWKGFAYSTIGLTAGSWLNFVIARFFGNRYIRGWIPPRHLERFDRLVSKGGIFVIFLLFVFPGFPKDYFCLFLGLTRLPLKIFILIAAIGRMPGTLMLSIQGASLYSENYLLFGWLTAICLVVAGIGWRYREPIYAWIEIQQKKNSR